MAERRPDVDVVMPVRDEGEHLGAAVDAIRAQAYPGELRIFIAVAPSIDDTATVAARLARDDDRIVVVANEAGTTPAGLNAAIRAGSAPVIVRVDGHSRLATGYTARAVDTLLATGAANVGGVQLPVGESPTERAIAAAMSSRLGTGGARFHVGGAPGPVDTVYLGAFDRAAIEAVGLFDESLLRNQDYELNIRLRSAGGVVWFDPTLSVEYRPRSSIAALARQYFEYGQYKRRVAAIHPSSLRARQVIPPVACLAAGAGLVAGIRWRPALALPLGYAATVGAASVAIARRRRVSPPRLAAVLTTMHFSWAAGFFRAMFRRRPVSANSANAGRDR